MRLIVELEEDGEVTREIVRQNVEEAIEYWKSNVGLSGSDDEGLINTIEVTLDEEEE